MNPRFSTQAVRFFAIYALCALLLFPSPSRADLITVSGASTTSSWSSLAASVYLGITEWFSALVDTVTDVFTSDTPATTTPGTYTLYYTATDQAGNTATTTRSVVVMDPFATTGTSTEEIGTITNEI